MIVVYTTNILRGRRLDRQDNCAQWRIYDIHPQGRCGNLLFDKIFAENRIKKKEIGPRKWERMSLVPCPVDRPNGAGLKIAIFWIRYIQFPLPAAIAALTFYDCFVKSKFELPLCFWRLKCDNPDHRRKNGNLFSSIWKGTDLQISLIFSVYEEKSTKESIFQNVQSQFLNMKRFSSN